MAPVTVTGCMFSLHSDSAICARSAVWKDDTSIGRSRDELALARLTAGRQLSWGDHEPGPGRGRGQNTSAAAADPSPTDTQTDT
ncbi:hypothetical protein ElyMa_003132300 [Elysia marginata]|uniref:Uncharacterized protein n=1 Tax=Elysia marginata TaxID=1093978 RepID=A0AAV4IV31_9GAST|nr:hypothetical protein ElyMa_003132300 [Elysia marginata]